MAYERANVVIPDQVFQVEAGKWSVAVGGAVRPEEYPSNGDAQIALEKWQRIRHASAIRRARPRNKDVRTYKDGSGI